MGIQSSRKLEWATVDFISMDGVKVTSWDIGRNDYDLEYTGGRAYILAKFDARMDISNSELAYLGYTPPPKHIGGTYGVSWKIKT